VRAEKLEWTLSAAMRTPQLWLMVVSQTFFWGTGCYLILAHVGKFTQDAGYSGLFAASMFALYGVSMVLGQLSAAISDWIGREVTVVIAVGLCIVGLVALLSVIDNTEPWRLYVYAISFGFGAGLQAPTIFAGAADLFYGKHFGSINGVVLAGMGIGGAFGPWVGGYLYDLSGTYQDAFILSAATFIVSAVTFVFAAPRKGITRHSLPSDHRA
jgi:MFS family permease